MPIFNEKINPQLIFNEIVNSLPQDAPIEDQIDFLNNAKMTIDGNQIVMSMIEDKIQEYNSHLQQAKEKFDIDPKEMLANNNIFNISKFSQMQNKDDVFYAKRAFDNILSGMPLSDNGDQYKVQKDIILYLKRMLKNIKRNNFISPLRPGVQKKLIPMLDSEIKSRLNTIKALKSVKSENIYNINKKANNEFNNEFVDDVDNSEIMNENNVHQEVLFADADDVVNFLDGINDVDEALHYFMDMADDDIFIENEDGSKHNILQLIDDSVSRYMEYKDSMSPQEKIELASDIFEALPDAVKTHENKGDNELPLTETKISQIINETNNIIKKQAHKLSKLNNKKSTVFNLSKTAQHKSVDQTIMWGPSGNKIDPFTGNVINNWHLVERNKGFGIKIDDVLDIDWETLWRQNIMDKYSRPYRDNDGNWVGGYIEKRFETDKYIPEGNNLQLKPGQRRRPVLNQYGLTEARLEHMRENEDRGYGPVSEGKPFNWKEASKKKIAQLRPLKNDVFDIKPLKPIGHDEKDNVSMSLTCPVCNSTNSIKSTQCSNCNTSLSGVKPTYHNHAPNPKGKKQKPIIEVMKNTRVAFNEKDKYINKEHCSDEDADFLVSDYIDEVEESADNLGII